MSSITLTNITKDYGSVKVIHSFNEFFNDKEFITLLGPSGCGKTTILRMIAGFEKPTTGEIRIDNQVVTSSTEFIPPNQRNIGMVFQSYAVWPHMNVFDNVAYPLKIQKLSHQEINQRVNEILENVNLLEYKKRMPNELSGGQQQRVALGRALVSKPKVLLLDEPLSNLDAKLRESMRFEIKEVQQKFGITVVYVTHDQTEAMAMSDRVIVFNNGVVQQSGTPADIYRKPANKFVADFVGKINFIEGFAENNKIILNGGQVMNYLGNKRGKITVAVRPENIIINKHNGILHGTVINSYYLGDINDSRINLDGTILRVVSPGNKIFDFGANANIYLDFDDFLIFD